MITMLTSPETQQAQCRRCMQTKPLKYMIPLYDADGTWDGVSYREWCYSCWARRRGAHPPDGTAAFFIPRDLRTRRYDRVLLKHRDPMADAALYMKCPPAGPMELKFSTVKREATAEIMQEAPTAQQILDRQQNPSKNDALSARHMCAFDGVARPNPPDTKRCDYCGLTAQEMAQGSGNV